MKKLILSFFWFLFCAGLSAQKVYFVYLQTEEQQPFFVRLDEKIFSSSSSGYLILSKLIDSTYNFKIGFPGKNLDLSFSTTMNKKDHGFLLKNFGEKGWGLVDLQTQSIQMSQTGKTSSNLEMKLDSTINAFTDLLSRAENDPSLRYTTILIEEEKADQKKTETTSSTVDNTKSETISQVPTTEDRNKTETVKNVDQKEEEAEKKSLSDIKEASYKKSEVKKISQSSVSDGIEITYQDKLGDKADTIKIVIDNPKSNIKSEEKTEENKPGRKFLDISIDTTRRSTETHSVKREEQTTFTVTEQKDTITVGKRNKINKCKSLADDNDFLKLRRKMAARTNDDGMIEEAKKYFKSKCFTTEQIRNLSSMFLSSAGKFNFFESAYEHTSDIGNFSGLQTELKDDFYASRFKALLQN